MVSHCDFLKKILFIFFRKKGRKGERERSIGVREIRQQAASRRPPSGDLARSPGMCPDWESCQ